MLGGWVWVSGCLGACRRWPSVSVYLLVPIPLWLCHRPPVTFPFPLPLSPPPHAHSPTSHSAPRPCWVTRRPPWRPAPIPSSRAAAAWAVRTWGAQLGATLGGRLSLPTPRPPLVCASREVRVHSTARCATRCDACALLSHPRTPHLASSCLAPPSPRRRLSPLPRCPLPCVCSIAPVAYMTHSLLLRPCPCPCLVPVFARTYMHTHTHLSSGERGQ
jgi:hypothetical protein